MWWRAQPDRPSTQRWDLLHHRSSVTGSHCCWFAILAMINATLEAMRHSQHCRRRIDHLEVLMRWACIQRLSRSLGDLNGNWRVWYYSVDQWGDTFKRTRLSTLHRYQGADGLGFDTILSTSEETTSILGRRRADICHILLCRQMRRQHRYRGAGGRICVTLSITYPKILPNLLAAPAQPTQPADLLANPLIDPYATLGQTSPVRTTLVCVPN